MPNVMMFSFGITSWYAARRFIDLGHEIDVLLFADTKIEDEDNYRFLNESANNLNVELVIIADGRTPFQTFMDSRFLGNSRVDICSRILKRDLIRKWLEDNCKPSETNCIYGLTWEEQHRIDTVRERWKPWNCVFPLGMAPFLFKNDILNIAKSIGLKPPRLYDYGFPHANCGGFCVKAGQSQFKRLFDVFPERYLKAEKEEEDFREFIQKDVSILKESRNGESKPLTLKTLRERIESNKQVSLFDWGGCGCMSDD